MSYFDDASLVMIPSGYKTSKVYSVKPTSGDGDLTFTRSNDTATRVGPNGLIEKVRTNLLLQSNSFDTTWANSNTTETGGQADKDGGNTAWKLDKSAASGYIIQSLSITGVHTFSVYAKAGTLDWIRLNINFTTGTDPIVYFNLSNGTIGSTPVGQIDAKIQSVGGGWYRCSVAANGTIQDVRFFPADGDNDVSGTSGNIYIQDAQLETGDIATDYIETTTAAVSVGPVANVPRLDYLNSSCPRLLLEPQRQNVWLFSEQANNAAWSNVEDTTVSANVGTSPDGYVNADKLIPQATSNLHRVSQAFAVTASTPYTFSVFVKRDGYDYFLIRTGDGTNNNVGYDLLNGTVTFEASGYTGFIQSYGNEWYRIGYVRSFAGTSASIFLRPNPTIVNFSNIPAFTGNGTSGALVWGAQLEQGSYASSYIGPTLGAAVTRGADTCSKTGISSLIGQTEGTLFAEVDFEYNSTTSSNLVCIHTGSSAAAISINRESNNRIQLFVFLSGAVQANILTTSQSIGTYKIAATYKQNDFKLYVNGSLIGTDTSGNIPTASVFSVGNLAGSNIQQNQIKQALVFETALSDADLAALTA